MAGRASGMIGGLLEMTDRIVWNGVFEGRFVNDRVSMLRQIRVLRVVTRAIPGLLLALAVGLLLAYV